MICGYKTSNKNTMLKVNVHLKHVNLFFLSSTKKIIVIVQDIHCLIATVWRN